MPTNLYGKNDNFDLETSHVLPAMLRKFHEAKNKKHNSLTLWGSGTPLREFLHVDDLADAVLFCLNNEMDESIYNVGSGSEISIKSLALLIKEITGFDGKIFWDKSKPDGTPRKIMDSSKINSKGWKSKIDLRHGIEEVYKWFINNQDNYKQVTII